MHRIGVPRGSEQEEGGERQFPAAVNLAAQLGHIASLPLNRGSEFDIFRDRRDKADLRGTQGRQVRVSALILQGDTLPPGAMRAMRRRGAISSINWSFNVLEPEPTTRDGWWLGETRSEHADHGYSSERLSMWNTDGRMVISGLQSVAVFG